MSSHIKVWLFSVLLSGLFAGGCNDDEVQTDTGGGDVTDAEADTESDVDTNDSGSDSAADPDTFDDVQQDTSSDAELDATDAETDVWDHPPTLDFAVGVPFSPDGVTDPFADSTIASCTIYLAEVCDDGAQQRCGVYDTDTETFVNDIDPLFEQVLLFERYYDLYHSPEGFTAERVFAAIPDPGEFEEQWGDPSNFLTYAGRGDSAIWTGAALNAHILRYLETGTEADYDRMEERTRAMVRLFDITGLDGHLARYPFLLLEHGAPLDGRHMLNYGEVSDFDHIYYVMDDPAGVPGLDPIYTEGLPGEGDTVWEGTAMYKANPSIDQYTGVTVTFPAAWGLLRDQTLRDRMAEHVTCYLRRLRRIELINLQDNSDALEAIRNLTGGIGLNLDPGDPDFSELDTLVAYVHWQPNSTNEDVYPEACPERIEMEPWRTIDASGSRFFLDMIEFLADGQSRDSERPNSFDHFYIPSVRGGDAVHLMNLAAMSYLFTGDQMYADFLEHELLGEIRTAEVALTMGALVLPSWCRSFYGHHIGFSPLWAFINVLEDSDLRTHMQGVMANEVWRHEMNNQGNAKFNLMYAGVVPPELSLDYDEALREGLEALAGYQGFNGVPSDPRRTYNRSFEDVLASLPEDTEIEALCPTPAERAACEDGFTALGLSIPGESITHECLDEPGECDMGEGLCAWPMASDALPIASRIYADFIWQRNPFEMRHFYGAPGSKQSPGLDLIEAFWLARYYDFIDSGDGQVLAWEELGSCD